LSLLVQHVILARKYRKFTDAIAPTRWKRETSTRCASGCTPTYSRRSPPAPRPI
jgi:hypothetical protein